MPLVRTSCVQGRSRVKALHIAIPRRLTSIFGNMLAEEISRHKSQFEGMLAPIVRNRNVQGLTWLKAVASQHRELFNGDSDVVCDFRHRVLEEVSNADRDDETHAVTSELADMLQIKPDKSPESV